MKLLKVNCDKSLISNQNCEFKEIIGICNKNDIMIYLNKNKSFYDSDNIKKKNFLYYVFHHKKGNCWLWLENKNDIQWLTNL